MYGSGKARHAAVELLLRELDATRADLAELGAALPSCDLCNAIATQNCIHGIACDAHAPDESSDLDYAHILRRLAKGSP